LRLRGCVRRLRTHYCLALNLFHFTLFVCLFVCLFVLADTCIPVGKRFSVIIVTQVDSVSYLYVLLQKATRCADIVCLVHLGTMNLTPGVFLTHNIDFLKLKS